MEIFLSKFLPQLVYPLGLVFILIVLALLTIRRPTLHKAVLIIALIILWVVSNRWTAMSLTRSLEWRFLPPEQLPTADAIVILGGGTLSQSKPRPLVEVNGAGDRVIYGAWLYHQGAAPILLLSGGNIDWLSSGSTPAEDMSILLKLMDIPQDALILETESVNTYENAQYSWNILEKKGINKILLVTSAVHMQRSVKFFEVQGFEVIPMPTDYTVTQGNWDSLFQGSAWAKILYALPNAENLALTSRILKEYLGMFYYNIKSWP